MVISHNLMADNANRQYNIVGLKKAKSTEKLSSGYRINRAADDAAGLTISEKLRWQVRGLTRAARNIEDGISFVQTGEGALGEVHSILQRMKELSIQASNDTNTDTDRQHIDDEIQQLKSETQRIFDETEFNGIFIFRAPYLPDVSSEPNDYKLFNAGNSNTLGGVVINSKRYTWDELGVPENGGENGWEISFKDQVGDDEELIHLVLEAGADRSSLHRQYEMSADETGIYVNNLLAGTWDGTIQQDGNKYSFSFHGMDISFTAENGATRDEIITRLNPDGISAITWDAIPSGPSGAAAVTSTRDGLMRTNVTQANKNDIENWTYSVTADEEGVTITQGNYSVSDGVDHIKIKWENFVNTDSGEPAYPIVDWGLTNDNPVAEDSLSDNPITVDNEATYHYGDVTNERQTDPITFDFSLPLDEASKAEVIKGLTQTLSISGITAPITAKEDVSDKIKVTGQSGFTFHVQRDLMHRDFGENGEPINAECAITRTKTNDGSYFELYQERKDMQDAYVKHLYEKQVTVKTYTGYMACDENGVITDDTILDPQEVAGERKIGDFVADTDRFGGAKLEKFTSQRTTDGNTETGAPVNNGDYVHGTEVVANGTDGEGNPLFKKAVTYTVTETTTRDRYDVSGDDFNIFLQNGSPRSNLDLYVYTTGYEAGNQDLTRASNGQVYHNYDKNNTSDQSAQKMISTSTTKVVDKVYQLNKYQYDLHNADDTGVFLSASSEYFLETYEGIKDSAIDYQADQQYADSASLSSYTGILSPENSDNFKDSVKLYGVAHYTDRDYKPLLNGQLANDYYVPNCASRQIDFTTTYEDNTVWLQMRYDDRDDFDSTKNASGTVTFQPDGPAYMDYSKPARSAGAATAQNLKIQVNPPEKLLHIQSGALKEQDIPLRWSALTNSIIGTSTVKTQNYGQAQTAIATVDDAIDYISGVRSKFGAYQNRMEHAVKINEYTAENTDAAESRIRDTDMAKETVEYSKQQILQQIGQSMLAQANQQTNGVLQILQ